MSLSPVTQLFPLQLLSPHFILGNYSSSTGKIEKSLSCTFFTLPQDESGMGGGDGGKSGLKGRARVQMMSIRLRGTLERVENCSQQLGKKQHFDDKSWDILYIVLVFNI